MKRNKLFTSASWVLGIFVVSSTLTLQAGFFGDLSIEDTDNDGAISAAELSEAFASARASAIENYDADGDGALSREERQAAAVENLDVDGDGAVSSEERTAGRDANRATISAAFDSDNNGELSDSERENLRDTVSEVRDNSGRSGRGGNGGRNGGER